MITQHKHMGTTLVVEWDEKSAKLFSFGIHTYVLRTYPHVVVYKG